MRDITRVRDECTPVEQRYLGRAIFGLFLGGFVSIRTQALPAGPPAEMSTTLRTSVALTGQTVTVYTLADRQHLSPGGQCARARRVLRGHSGSSTPRPRPGEALSAARRASLSRRRSVPRDHPPA